MIYIEKSHSHVFAYIARVISHELNLPNEITNDFSKTGTWILFASAYVTQIYKNISGPYIVVQTEYFKQSNNPDLRKPEYLEFLKNASFVWEFTDNFKFGYSIVNEIEFEESKPIDVLFYGSKNDRRLELLSKIKNVNILDANDRNSWFPNLWNHIRNSKIVLSIHYYIPSENDLFRIAPLLSNSTFVIAEKSTCDNTFNCIEDIIIAEYDEIPKLCEYYLKHPEKRLLWKRRGYDYILRNPLRIPTCLNHNI
jgi:hypothetical protein